jgi:hypothetical protein
MGHPVHPDDDHRHAFIQDSLDFSAVKRYFTNMRFGKISAAFLAVVLAAFALLIVLHPG